MGKFTARRLWLNLLTLFLLALLIIPCTKTKKGLKKLFLLLVYKSYAVSWWIFNWQYQPCHNYVGTIGVGLVLFERKIVYLYQQQLF